MIVFNEGGVESKRADEKNFYRDEAGFTLIEALVVMVVGVAVLAGAAAGIGRLFSASNVTTEAQNITMIAANVKGMKDGPNGYTALSNGTALKFKAIPENMTISGENITNLWNGAVTLTPTNSGKSFNIAYASVPADACKQIALKLKGGGWEKLAAGKKGDTEIKPSAGLADIDAACADKDGAGVTMTFTSK
ncbi:type 4 pilus major pilin [Burkholderia cenocepacia]|uniref:type 4 pilus major pilin n=1 Tax=Burkholderia cenocepacia TaxID=95486 RepID=UPI002AAFB662|nr:type 4 pilus major pilin [Burkholderia cenocepacia]